MSAEVKAILEAVQKLNPEQRVELERELRAMQGEVDVDREQVVRSIRGKYKFVPTSVDEFLKRKHEDLDREEHL